jgi:hypothetical protein
MATKLTDVMNTFNTGDVVFTRYPSKGLQPIHATLFLAPGTGIANPSYVHAGEDWLEISGVEKYKEDEDAGSYLRIETPAARRASTTAVALAFARNATRTPYGKLPLKDGFVDGKTKSPTVSRFSGMIKTTDCAEIPFTFAALRRLLKWTMKFASGAPLSKNRGVTCAAFVSICHQVGGMKDFLSSFPVYHDAEKFKKVLQALDALAVTKAKLRENLEELQPAVKTPKTFHRGQALRENSNRELTVDGLATLKLQSKELRLDRLDESVLARLKDSTKPVSEIDKLWVTIQTQYLEIPEASVQLLDQIMPAEFIFDAKYVSSMALSTRMAALGWHRTICEKY